MSEKMSHSTWLELSKNDPTAARLAFEADQIEVPDYIARNRPGYSPERTTEQRRATTVEEVIEQNNRQNEEFHGFVAAIDAQRQASLPGGRVEDDPHELPEGAAPIDFAQWVAMSKRNPAKAKAYHRADLVNVPDYIADSLEG